MHRWIIGARPRTLPAAIVPVALGASCAVGAGDVVWWLSAVLMGIAVVLTVTSGLEFARDAVRQRRAVADEQRI